MRAVFKDPEQEKEFQKNGYIHVPFLSKEEVKFLWDKFHELIQKSGGNLSSGETDVEFEGEITYDFTFIDKNIDYKKEVFKVIDEVFAPHYEKILNNFEPIIANYIRKTPKAGEVPMHQNWAFTDERKATSVSIWVPLVDSHRGNGALEVVPGSHKRFGENRGPLIPWELEGIKDEIIKNDLITCDIKAGEAIVLDDSIVHYSYPNNTNELRIAIQLILIPADLPSFHYHRDFENNANEIQILEVNHDFYMQFNPWKKPENVKKIGAIPFKETTLNYAQFKQGLFKRRFDEPQTVLDKIKAVFAK